MFGGCWPCLLSGVWCLLIGLLFDVWRVPSITCLVCGVL